MEITYEHGLEVQEAYARTDGFLNGLMQQNPGIVKNPKKSWNSGNTRMDFSFEAYGFKISGGIILDDHKVTVKGALPILAMPLKGQIERTIRENLEAVLG